MEILLTSIFMFNLITFLLNVFFMCQLFNRISECPRKVSDLLDWKFERIDRKIDWISKRGN